MQWVEYSGELGEARDVTDATAERMLGENHAPDAIGYWEDAGPVTASSPPAGADHVLAIYGIAHELLGFGQVATDAVCQWQFGTDVKGLTRQQAEQFIEYMKEVARESADAARLGHGAGRVEEGEEGR